MKTTRNALTALAVTAMLLLPAQILAGTGDYRSAGVGLQERKVFSDYSLKLVFANLEGALVAGVKVTVMTPDGNTIISAEDTGPWLLAQLEPGEYDVVARAPSGETTSAKIQIGDQDQTSVVLSFSSPSKTT